MKKLLCIALCLACLSITAGRKRERSETPQDGAVLQMGFNEGPGAKDWSGQGNDATNNSGAVWGYTNGVSGGGFVFDGVNDKLDIRESNPTDLIGTLSNVSFTISLWANTRNATNRQYFIGVGNYSISHPLVGIDYTGAGQIEFVVRDSDLDAAIVVGSVAINTWNHFVLVWDKSTKTVYGYQNGGLVGSTQNTDISYTIFRTAQIGALLRESESFFTDGTIDEVYVYHGVRSATEIKGLYEQGKANQNP
jgi:hypothetical protein